MKSREAIARTLARYIFDGIDMAKDYPDDDDRITFQNLMAAGIDAGFHAFYLNQDQKMAGRIGHVSVIFEEPRIL